LEIDFVVYNSNHLDKQWIDLDWDSNNHLGIVEMELLSNLLDKRSHVEFEMQTFVREIKEV